MLCESCVIDQIQRDPSILRQSFKLLWDSRVYLVCIYTENPEKKSRALFFQYNDSNRELMALGLGFRLNLPGFAPAER